MARLGSSHRRAELHSPAEWPTVVHWKKPEPKSNQLDQKEVGNWRPENSMVMAAGLNQYHETVDKDGNVIEESLFKKRFVLPEAGPRENLYFPRRRNKLNVAVLVSGGIAPGINAVVGGIVERHKMYQKFHDTMLTIYGYQNGFYAFDENENEAIRSLSSYVESGQTYEGGSVIGTSRVKDLIDEETRIQALSEIDLQLRVNGIDILYIIGGDGSMKAAHALWNVAQDNELRKRNDQPLSVVAIPKTMDNDILWMWQSFGFLSAVQEAREFIERLHVEVNQILVCA